MAYDDWREFQWGRSGLDTVGYVFRWVEAQAKVGKLQIVGKTDNHRWKVRSEEFLLEVDKTVFPDGSIEAEIECETDNPELAKKHIEALWAPRSRSTSVPSGRASMLASWRRPKASRTTRIECSRTRRTRARPRPTDRREGAAAGVGRSGARCVWALARPVARRARRSRRVAA